MKRPMSKRALEREASFWGNIKKMTKANPGKTCHK